MGCGAISKSEEPFTPYLQFKKTKNICRGEGIEIWECQNFQKEKYLIKIFKNVFVNEQTQQMYENFQEQITRLRKLVEEKSNNTQSNRESKNLIQYIKAWKDENRNLTLIMRCMECKSIGDFVKGKLPGLFTQSMVGNFCYQILKTIKYLRQKGSIFCNIKPTNIFFSNDKKNVILGDYYNLQEYFHINKKSFTKDPIYSAPQNVIFSQYFKGSDIWRVGCFAIQALTCIKPWYQETTDSEKILQNLRNFKAPPFPQKISIECKDFLQKCFEIDHNKRSTVDQLLKHVFIKKNKQNQITVSKKFTQQLEKEKNQLKQTNDNKSGIKIHNLDVITESKKNSQSEDTQRKIEQISPFIQTLEQSPTLQYENRKKSFKRKKSISNYQSYNKANNQIANSNNYRTSIKGDEKQKFEFAQKETKALKFRTKRLKTQNYTVENQNEQQLILKLRQQKQEILSLLNKTYDINCENPSPQIHKTPSRKVSRTSNFVISQSKKRISQNKLLLNNQAIITEHSSSKYWPKPEIAASFDYEQTQKTLTSVIKQIQTQGGDKYYKKPLRLLKRKLKDKYTLRTQTSITLQDSRMLDENEEIQEVNLEPMFSNDSINLYTEQSKLSFQTHEQQVIETAVTKAQKNRIITEQKVLLKQRQSQKQKWQRQLKEGRQLIKNDIHNRYYSKPRMKSYQ